MHGEPLLRPTAIDHILVNVSDVPRAAAFYQKLLGGVIRVGGNAGTDLVQRPAGKDRVGLGLAEPGHKLGIDHYCLTAAFDPRHSHQGLGSGRRKDHSGRCSRGP